MSVDFGYEASTNGAGGEQHTVTALFGQSGAQILRTRPELLVGAAFAGGVIAALLLRRLGR